MRTTDVKLNGKGWRRFVDASSGVSQAGVLSIDLEDGTRFRFAQGEWLQLRDPGFADECRIPKHDVASAKDGVDLRCLIENAMLRAGMGLREEGFYFEEKADPATGDLIVRML